MGSVCEAECLNCGENFWVRDGGSFFFHLLRCEECGATTSIRLEELGEVHLRYLKGRDSDYSALSAEYDRYVRKQVPVEPLSEVAYLERIEDFAGCCECGGRFIFGAPVRCSACRSARVIKGPPTLVYD